MRLVHSFCISPFDRSLTEGKALGTRNDFDVASDTIPNESLLQRLWRRRNTVATPQDGSENRS